MFSWSSTPRSSPSSLVEQHFGGVVTPEDIHLPKDATEFYQNLALPLGTTRPSLTEHNHPTYERTRFHVNLDPASIKVSHSNNMVIVEASHGERMDAHGFVSRRFVRKFPLPKRYSPERLKVVLFPDGVLAVIAPLVRWDEAVEE